MAIIESNHLGKLFLARVAASADRPAFTHQVDGVRTHLSWRELADRVLAIAQYIAGQGVGPGDRVALLAENGLDWVCTDLALHLLRAVHVPIHASLSGHQAAYQMLHAGAKLVIYSGDAQAEKVRSLCEEDWIALAENAQTPLDAFRAGVSFTAFDAIRGEGARRAREAPSEPTIAAKIDAALADARGDDLATILYTSGTTGEPKGVKLTHANLTSNALAAVRLSGEGEGDRRFTFLPLSHVFARTCDLYTWVAAGSTLELARSRETAVADLRASGATLVSVVPFFLERIYGYLCDQGLLEHPTAAKELMGGRLRIANSGGAALPDYLYDYFNAHGVPLYQGYGLSETSPIISCCGPGRDRRGSAGLPIEGIEVAISPEGEILTRGPHVMPGYYRNEAATREVIVDGWFHTGDLGRLDAEGFLYITGRKKEIIVLSSGKNISPALIEGLLLRDPLISQIAIFGDGQHALTALIVPHVDQLKKEFSAAPLSEVLMSDACRRRFREILAERLQTLSPHEQIKAFALLESPFSIEAGEVTAKMSLRRNVIASRYRELLEALYRETPRAVPPCKPAS